MYYVLDRREGSFAVFVCDNGTVISRKQEPFSKFREGDVFLLREGELVFSPAETARRKIHIRARFHRLTKRKK